MVSDNKFCILPPRPNGGEAKVSKIFLAFTIKGAHYEKDCDSYEE